MWEYQILCTLKSLFEDHLSNQQNVLLIYNMSLYVGSAINNLKYQLGNLQM